MRVQYLVKDRTAVLTIDNPPVNALSADVQEGLRGGLTRALTDPDVRAIVITGAGTTFVAGADIKQLEAMAYSGVVESALPEILGEMELGPKPIITAIHGNALGGGLEIALASHYRIASPGSKIGQPEVKLGIIPGAGGTQRLPRLAGVETALEMCVFGEPIRAEDAHRLGVIDRIAHNDLVSEAIAYAEELAGVPIRRTRDLINKLGANDLNSTMFAAFRERIRKTRKNLLAPAAAIDAIEAATKLPFDGGCRSEREIFKGLLVSSQAKALIYVFFAERAATKIPGLDKSTRMLSIQSAVVIGAGTMGRGIAMCCANAGIPVRLKEAKQHALDGAMAAIREIYKGSVDKGRISASEMNARLERIQPQLNDAGFSQADVVIDAAFENLDVKREIFAELGRVTKPETILATNTSYFDINQIAAACGRPEQVIGLHFFNPANVMRLLEIVPGKETSKNVIATSMAIAKKLGKLAVIAGNCPGFIGNRMLRVYRREAQLLLEEGASPRQVDSALEEWGMAMGPFAVQDLAGIDIAMSSRHVFAQLDAPGARVPSVIDALHAAGRYGQKSGAGWYRYDEKRAIQPDPAVDELIELAAKESGTARRTIAGEEIVERCVYALINEGARILDDGHALRASDIDLVYLNGYGFPAYRGGPMHFADATGLKTIYDRILKLRGSHGVGWEPAPLLMRLSEAGGCFAAWDEERSKMDATGRVDSIRV